MARASIAIFMLFCLPVFAAPSGLAEPEQAGIERAFEHMYNFNFPAAHAVLNQYIALHPEDPLPYAVRSSAYLFSELDRLGILESEFFSSNKRIADKKKLKPDPDIRSRFYQSVQDAQNRAQRILTRKPDDQDALFAMCISSGVTTDYTALVEKKQIRSLSTARQSNDYATRLLKIDPHFYDAYLTTGVTEYLVGSLPFFVRWFVHFDNVQGSKTQGVENLKLVAQSGHYLRPFAKILLGIVYLREKQPEKTEKLLQELARDYPQNPLIQNELAKISMHTKNAAN